MFLWEIESICLFIWLRFFVVWDKRGKEAEWVIVFYMYFCFGFYINVKVRFRCVWEFLVFSIVFFLFGICGLLLK